MKSLLVLTVGAALAAGACGTAATDARDTVLPSDTTVAQAAAPPPARAAVPARPVYRNVTIPAGTTLALVLTSALASDTSMIEDPVSARLTQAITVDGRDVVPAGGHLDGVVTGVDGSGRVRGRGMIAFRFTSLRTGEARYDVQASPVTYLAPATKGEDATKVGIGAGAGAIVGGILGGGSGAATGAAIGGAAGTGVVLATKGEEVRLGPGADATSQLTAPLTVRVRIE
jgi:hypothetical protein